VNDLFEGTHVSKFYNVRYGSLGFGPQSHDSPA
jgi:hypothetical protein